MAITYKHTHEIITGTSMLDHFSKIKMFDRFSYKHIKSILAKKSKLVTLKTKMNDSKYWIMI